MKIFRLTFRRGDVSAIDVELGLVPFQLLSTMSLLPLLLLLWLSLDLGNGAVTSLVDILVEVFDRGDGRGDLDIDVSVVLCGEVRIVRYDPLVVVLEASLGKNATIVTPPIDRIAVLVHDCGSR